MNVELDELDPIRVAQSAFEARCPELARALECVFAMPAELARQAVAAGVQWDERASRIVWKSSGDTVQSFATNRGHFDAEQAWEALVATGVIGDDWLASGDRVFETQALHRALLDRSMERKRTPHPHTLKACALVASDARAVETVETLAREGRAALEPWGLAPIDRPIVWQFDERSFFSHEGRLYEPEPERPNKHLVIAPAHDPWRAVEFVRNCDAVLRASRALGAVEPSLLATSVAQPGRSWRNRRAKIAFVLAHDALRWERAAREDRRIARPPHDPEFPGALEGARFASLPNPFSPLATLFTLGYGVESVEAAVHLLCIEP